MDNIQYGWERSKDIIEKEAKEGQDKQAEENIDLAARENERASKGSYRSFVISGTPKADIDSYFDWAKLHIKALIKDQLREMQPTKVIMML